MVIACLQRIERGLLPLPDRVKWNEGRVFREVLSLPQKVSHVASNFFLLSTTCFYFPVVAACSCARSLAGRAISLFSRSVPRERLFVPSPGSPALPPHFGFADSLFQTSGLGTRFSPIPHVGRSHWDRWLTPAHIEGTEDGEYDSFFVEVVSRPEPFIQMLTEMGATAYRVSLEWSVIEPREGGYDRRAIEMYRTFFQKLKRAGIEPYVTLHHFVHPEWFEASGGFDESPNVHTYGRYALDMMEFFPEVNNWMTFNEPGVFAFQSWRGVYPWQRRGGLAKAANLMRNLLIAHCLLYPQAKLRFNDRIQIGITHQWLKFEPLTGNFLEKIICYFLSKITHYAVYNFFKTGTFSLQIPFVANVEFSIPREEFLRMGRLCDWIGGQFYSFPRLKAGWNGGEKYPGYKVTNLTWWRFGLTFGSTCPRGGEMMSFGPGYYPESFREFLREAEALEKPFAITEIGCDARVQKWGRPNFEIDDDTQRRYFTEIFPMLSEFRGTWKAFFIWTLIRGHLEWDRGGFPRLGLVTPIKNRHRFFTGYRAHAAAQLIQEVYRRKREEIEKRAA